MICIMILYRAYFHAHDNGILVNTIPIEDPMSLILMTIEAHYNLSFSADGAIMWLWRTHNRVNKRLSGDLTDDPQRPKTQFPAPAMCGKCWSTHRGMHQLQYVPRDLPICIEMWHGTC